MKRTVLATSISLAVSALLIAGAGSPAAAADTPRPHPPKASNSQAVHDARDSIAAHPKAVRASSDDTFDSASVQVDKDGTRHVHMTREYRGLPVLGGDVVVHSAPSGAFRESTLTLKDSLSLPVTPKVGARHAEALAQKEFQGRRASTTSKLVVDALSGTPRLAWQVTVDGTAPDQSPSHFNVLVDALT
ncbi:peptidase M4 family protein, partial [[Kitasatospora] papulosa]